MTPAEQQALLDIRGLASANRVVFGPHARARMVQRNVRLGDAMNALRRAGSCRAAEGGRFRVEGPDLDGDDLTLVVAIEGDLVVVTVF